MKIVRTVPVAIDVSLKELAQDVSALTDVEQAEFLEHLAEMFYAWPVMDAELQLLRIAMLLKGKKQVKEMLLTLLEGIPE